MIWIQFLIKFCMHFFWSLLSATIPIRKLLARPWRISSRCKVSWPEILLDYDFPKTLWLNAISKCHTGHKMLWFLVSRNCRFHLGLLQLPTRSGYVRLLARSAGLGSTSDCGPWTPGLGRGRKASRLCPGSVALPGRHRDVHGVGLWLGPLWGVGPRRFYGAWNACLEKGCLMNFWTNKTLIREGDGKHCEYWEWQATNGCEAAPLLFVVEDSFDLHLFMSCES